MKSKTIGLSFGALFLIFLAIQLVPIDRTNPPITAEIQAPPEVATILRRSCYDCHSSETRWPWYSRVAPASLLLDRDVREGRREVNFSEWGTFPPARKTKKLKESLKELQSGDMPPWYYLPMHPDAKLSAEDKTTLEAWFQAQLDAPAP